MNSDQTDRDTTNGRRENIMSNECDKTTEELKTQVFELLGRCVLNLQKYELGMKGFLSVLEMEGTPETWQSNLHKRQSHYGSKTLGQLIGDFTGSHISSESGNESESEIDDSLLPTDSVHFKTKYRIVAGGDDYQTLLDDLTYLVETRNELVHHFLQRFPLDDQDSCLQAIDHLETVRKMLKSHMERLQSWDQARVRGMSALKDFLHSPQFTAWIKFGFIPGDDIDWPSASVVEELKRAESTLSKNGWTDLTLAIEAVKNRNPDLTPEAHGCVSWPNLLHTSGLFDIRRERGQGATSIVYFRSR
ncbi:OST-HTH/LOTUS domain-containing protein [Marinobacter salarius]|nr:OST-HTH/LOTUS domain-containing protein [Marinobacter salarius]